MANNRAPQPRRMETWLKAYLIAALLVVFAITATFLMPGSILQGTLFTAAVVIAIMGTVGLIVSKLENKNGKNGKRR